MCSWPDEDDGDLDDEGPDESDRDDSDDDTRPCPHCGKEIYEQAEMCPHCGMYLSSEDAPSHRPMWILITGIVLVAAMIASAAWLWF